MCTATVPKYLIRKTKGSLGQMTKGVFCSMTAGWQSVIKVNMGEVADETHSDSHGLYREMQVRSRRDDEIVAWRTETGYKAQISEKIV